MTSPLWTWVSLSLPWEQYRFLPNWLWGRVKRANASEDLSPRIWPTLRPPWMASIWPSLQPGTALLTIVWLPHGIYPHPRGLGCNCLCVCLIQAWPELPVSFSSMGHCYIQPLLRERVWNWTDPSPFPDKGAEAHRGAMTWQLGSCTGCTVLRPLTETGLSEETHTWAQGLGPSWAVNFTGGGGGGGKANVDTQRGLPPEMGETLQVAGGPGWARGAGGGKRVKLTTLRVGWLICANKLVRQRETLGTGRSDGITLLKVLWKW